MAVTINKYNQFLFTQMNGGNDTTNGAIASLDRVVDFDTDTIKVMLCSSSYVPSAANHAVISHVSGEITGGGYTSGGVTLTNTSLTSQSGIITFNANDAVWSQSQTGFDDARYAVIYKDSGFPDKSTLIAWVDFGIDKNNLLNDFSIVWSAAGIITWA